MGSGYGILRGEMATAVGVIREQWVASGSLLLRFIAGARVELSGRRQCFRRAGMAAFAAGGTRPPADPHPRRVLRRD